MTAPWLAPQLAALLHQRGHAWLLSGPSGLGQFALALALVRAWLCDAPLRDGLGACGHCTSCHAVDVHTHADLCVLLPEALALEFGWPLDEKTQSELDAKKSRPSREIKVDAVRELVAFTQRTRSRGATKAVLVYPADRMNAVAANTLLKTLEEPPGDVKFVLVTDAANRLLPTITSRCQTHAMGWPATAAARDWLVAQGVADPATAALCLRASGDRPGDALRLARAGFDAPRWTTLPKQVARGDVAALRDFTPAQAVDALQKLCHDLLAAGCDAPTRYFDVADLPVARSFTALTDWAKALFETSRTVEHPFHAPLMLEALVNEASRAISSSA